MVSFLFDRRENHNRADRSTPFETHFVPGKEASDPDAINTLAGGRDRVGHVLPADLCPRKRQKTPSIRDFRH
jgi:hypothetical protein